MNHAGRMVRPADLYADCNGPPEESTMLTKIRIISVETVQHHTAGVGYCYPLPGEQPGRPFTKVVLAVRPGHERDDRERLLPIAEAEVRCAIGA